MNLFVLLDNFCKLIRMENICASRIQKVPPPFFPFFARASSQIFFLFFRFFRSRDAKRGGKAGEGQGESYTESHAFSHLDGYCDCLLFSVYCLLVKRRRDRKNLHIFMIKYYNDIIFIRAEKEFLARNSKGIKFFTKAIIKIISKIISK